jgi:hypothetical protein
MTETTYHGGQTMDTEPTLTVRYEAGRRLAKMGDTLVGMRWCQEQELASIAPLTSVERRTARYVDHRAQLALASLGGFRRELTVMLEPVLGEWYPDEIAACREAIAEIDGLIVDTLATVWTIAEPTLGGVA